jgi:hypothetical protein
MTKLWLPLLLTLIALPSSPATSQQGASSVSQQSWAHWPVVVNNGYWHNANLGDYWSYSWQTPGTVLLMTRNKADGSVTERSTWTRQPNGMFQRSYPNNQAMIVNGRFRVMQTGGYYELVMMSGNQEMHSIFYPNGGEQPRTTVYRRVSAEAFRQLNARLAAQQGTAAQTGSRGSTAPAGARGSPSSRQPQSPVSQPSASTPSRSNLMPGLQIPGYRIQFNDSPRNLSQYWTRNNPPIFGYLDTRSGVQLLQIRVQSTETGAQASFTSSGGNATIIPDYVSFSGGGLRCKYNIYFIYRNSRHNVSLLNFDLCTFNDVDIWDDFVYIEQGFTAQF